MTTEEEGFDRVPVSQSGSALRGAPSGSEPSAPFSLRELAEVAAKAIYTHGFGFREVAGPVHHGNSEYVNLCWDDDTLVRAIFTLHPDEAPAGLTGPSAAEALPVAALTVETAAIRIGDAFFTLPRPNRHHNVMWWLSVLGIGSGLMHDQGFILSDGTYASRRAAAIVALRALQVEKLHAPPELFSEDLWDGGADLPGPDDLQRLTAPRGVPAG